MDFQKPCVIDIPIVHDQRGNLSVVEGGELVPFDIKRLYYLYDVPGGAIMETSIVRSLLFAECLKFESHNSNRETRDRFLMDFERIFIF